MFWQEPYIPPCCDQKFFSTLLLERMSAVQTETIYPNADYSLSMFLSRFITARHKQSLTICLPEAMHPDTLRVIKRWIGESIYDAKAEGKVPWITSLHIVVPQGCEDSVPRDLPRTTLSVAPFNQLIILSDQYDTMVVTGNISQTATTGHQSIGVLTLTLRPRVIDEIRKLIDINTRRSHIYEPATVLDK